MRGACRKGSPLCSGEAAGHADCRSHECRLRRTQKAAQAVNAEKEKAAKVVVVVDNLL